MRLTRKGDARYRAMLKELHALGAELTKGVGENELKAAMALIRSLRERMPVD
jgi:DNA-binding MarR family transcriptional regulator